LHNPTDEQLMAFADGALSTHEHERVARAVASSPELQARVKQFSATGGALASAFDSVLDAPVPAAWVQMINTAIQPGESQVRRATQRTQYAERDPGPLRQLLSSGGIAGGVPFGTAVASWAGIALLAGAAGWWLNGGGVQPDSLVASRSGMLVADGTLAALLETQKSGAVVVLPGATQVAATASFRNHSGEVCREYQLTSAQPVAGVACRQDDGVWRIELHTQVARTVKSGAAVPAVGVGTDVYEAAINALREGNELTPAAEAQVMQNWGVKAP
jgi:anti-sigma factor RsiW